MIDLNNQVLTKFYARLLNFARVSILNRLQIRILRLLVCCTVKFLVSYSAGCACAYSGNAVLIDMFMVRVPTVLERTIETTATCYTLSPLVSFNFEITVSTCLRQMLCRKIIFCRDQHAYLLCTFSFYQDEVDEAKKAKVEENGDKKEEAEEEKKE